METKKDIPLKVLGGSALAIGYCMNTLPELFPMARVALPFIYPFSMFALGSTTLLYDYYLILKGEKGNLIKGLGLKNKEGVAPTLIKKQKGEVADNYIYSLPAGLSVDDFNKHRTAIANYHEVDKTEIGYNGGQVIVKIYKKPLPKNIPYVFHKLEINEILIGQSHYGIETLKLNNDNPHCLIAGETGGGKSVFMRVIITNVILNANGDIEIYLVDFKYGVEFEVFNRCKYVKKVYITHEECDQLFSKLIQEMERRYNKLKEKSCTDIDEYNKKNPEKLKRKFIFIDEFADLMEEKEIKKKLMKLLAQARAVGIHFIICTQRPDSKILDGNLKQNIPAVVGLKTIDNINSRIIIKNENAALEKLRGRGHAMIYGYSKRAKYELMETQQYFLSVEEARELIKHTYIEEKKEVAKKEKPQKRKKAEL